MAGLTNITLNGSNCVAVRLFIPYKGVWFADVDVDPEIAQAFLARGPADLLIGTTALIGTIDPKSSGRFMSMVRVRVVGGGNGWDTLVPPQHIHQEGQLLSTQVYAATAAIVGEVVTDVVPAPVGKDFVRTAGLMGPASRVFQDKLWWVDTITPVTFVAPVRPPAVPDLSLEVISYDPREGVVHAVCDAPIVPGTPLIDTSGNVPPRWDGVLQVVDVEQFFTHEGSRANLWVANAPISRLASALINLVREGGKLDRLKLYLYTFALPEGTGKLALVPTDITCGAPPLLPANVWGPAGIGGTYTPGTQVVVALLNGDSTHPVAIAFDNTPPLTVTVDAAVEVDVGATTAPLVKVGAATGVTVLNAGVRPLAFGDWALALMVALEAHAAALTASTTLANVIATGAALTTALTLPAFPTPATTKVTGA